MIKVLISGASGKMGGFVYNEIQKQDDMEVCCGVDIINNGQPFPIYDKISNVCCKPDVIIDFSHPAMLDSLIDFAKDNNTPIVLATTGYSQEQTEKIKNTSKEIPVFFTFNMSIGVNLICSLAKKAAEILGNSFDVEIVEKHHNQKIDAPSGTAIMLANAVNSVFDDKMSYEYDRHSKRQKRTNKEIGIHSIRGGTIVGEHDVIFAGHDEVITISHQAQSKEVFAAGAVKAARFLVNKSAGIYDMTDVTNIK